MTNKQKIAIAITTAVLGSIISILWINYDLIYWTYALAKVEVKISYYLPKENSARQDLQDLTHTMNELRKQKKELELRRIDLSESWKWAEEAIADWNIIINQL